MSKNISISDELYEKLRREKDDRSFSEVIEENLKEGGRVADVAGQVILDTETYEKVKEEIGQLSRGTAARLENEDT